MAQNASVVSDGEESEGGSREGWCIDRMWKVENGQRSDQLRRDSLTDRA